MPSYIFWRREMRIKTPWYRAALSVRGFEETQAPAPVTDPGSVTDPAPGTEAKEPADDPAAGLKSALEKERAERKDLQKRLAAFEKAQQVKTDAEKTEIERLTDQDKRTSAKLQKLSEGYRKSAVERAITAAARKAEFTDPTDALRPEVLAAIGVEQDEDDPSSVTVDETTVTNAVKALAKERPHYLATKKAPPSGSKFGGRPTVDPALTQEQLLLNQYPALARRRG